LFAHTFVARDASGGGGCVFKAGFVIFAGQEAESQRRIGQERDVQAAAGFIQRVFMAAVQETIGILHADDARQSVRFGQAREFMRSVGRFVGKPDVAHLVPARTSCASACNCSRMGVWLVSFWGS
jgi:hypothetical protein